MMMSRSLALVLYTVVVVSQAQAKMGRQFPGLMTGQDFVNRAFSNITITNGTSSAVTSSGLYIASFDVNDCSACFGNVVAGNNAIGSFVQPVPFAAQEALPIGQNYLYNLIYNGIYGIKNTVGSSPCVLPGCSWPGDDPNVHGWCLSIGIMSRHSTYTSSSYVNGANPPANAVPFAEAVSSNPFNYKYDLLDPFTLGTGSACLGPIVCNDQSLTCTVAIPQNETFQAY